MLHREPKRASAACMTQATRAEGASGGRKPEGHIRSSLKRIEVHRKNAVGPGAVKSFTPKNKNKQTRSCEVSDPNLVQV